MVNFSFTYLNRKEHLSQTLLSQYLKNWRKCNKKFKDYQLTQKRSKNRYLVLSLAQRVSNKKIKFLKRSQEMEFIDKVQFTIGKIQTKIELIRGNNRKPAPKKSCKQRSEPQIPILNQNEKKKIIKCWFCKRSEHLIRKC